MNALEFEGIRRAYKKGVNVLDGVSFGIEPGQVVGLLGKNGAGKTTLIRIAMGMIEPQEGTVRVLGLDPGWSPRFARRYEELGKTATEALKRYRDDVRGGSFPSDDESFS